MTRDRETHAATPLSRHPLALTLACVLLAGGTAASYRLAKLAHLDLVAAERVAVSSQLDHVRGDLSRELFASLNLSEGLVTLVRLRGGIQQDEFDALAAAIVGRSAVVRNVALARGTVITYIYPLAGNETALGVDYIGVPNQRTVVLKAIRERRTVVAGPLSLIQGGMGIIGRTPIFSRVPGPQGSGTDTYWGIAATVVSLERLLEVSGLERARGSLRLALRGLDGTGGDGPAFWGDVDIFQADAVLMDVPLPSGSWVVAGAPKDGWPVFVAWRSPELLTGTALSLALAVLAFQVLRVSRQRKAEVVARQRIEQDLRDVNRALAIKQFAIESVTSGIALVGLDGRVTYANHALAPMLGLGDVEAGTTLSGLLGAAAADTVGRALEGRGAWRGELVAPGTAGGPGGSRELDGAVDTVHGPGGEALCHILILQDVTERKRMMAEVERSQRLSALSVFAGGVAHDFNNLLGGLFGNIELARTGLSPGHPAAAHLETASSAFERARDLTRRLLTFAIGSPPQRRRLAVVPFLRECCALSLSGSSSPWEIDEPAGLWDVLADANQLSQVVANILINARQAMRDGGRVRLRVHNHEVSPADTAEVPAGRYVEITIEDEGPGVPPDVLPRIFEPFFTTKPSGSGLGLAMSSSIVSAHGGRLSAAAAPGGGAAFTMLLPAVETDTSDVQPSRPDTHGDERSCGRIILMDDEKLIRDMAARMLTRSGYEVVPARDGDEAVRLCRDAVETGHPFDAAILDVTVPGGMGGKEALRHLRDVQPGLAVVLSSGYGEISAAVGECQPTAVLPKPYQMHELLACARAVVQRVPPPPA